MPGGNDNEVNALYEIACNTRQMAINAGVADPGGNGYVNDEDALSQQIACNLFATNQALGGTCSPTWVDQATAWQAILQLTVELATLTGGPSDQGFYELPLVGVLCNLEQVATNTGSAVPPPENLFAQGVAADTISLSWDAPAGPAPDSFNIYRSTVDGGPYTLLDNVGGGFSAYDDNTVVQGTTYYYVVTSVIGGQESVYSNQASAEPLSDLQIFINALNVFAPDVLLVADTIGAASVALWEDQSGNGANATPSLAAGPPPATPPARNVASVNGRNSVLFNGTTDELEGAYVNNTALSSVFVVYRNTAVGNGPTYVTTAAVTGGGDATTGQPVLLYNGANSPVQTNAYLGSVGGIALSAANQFRLGVGITDGTNSNVYDQGAFVAPNPYAGPMATTLYCVGQNSAAQGGRGLTGDIAFVMLFKSDQTANMAAISALINAYYGL